MSQENVETVYRLYAASRRRDQEACVRESDPDVEVVSYLMGIEGTVYRGHAGLRRYIDDLFRAFPTGIRRSCGQRTAETRSSPRSGWRGQGSSSGIAIEQTGLADHHFPRRQDGRVPRIRQPS